jgi:hypothetical protein
LRLFRSNPYCAMKGLDSSSPTSAKCLKCSTSPIQWRVVAAHVPTQAKAVHITTMTGSILFLVYILIGLSQPSH